MSETETYFLVLKYIADIQGDVCSILQLDVSNVVQHRMSNDERRERVEVDFDPLLLEDGLPLWLLFELNLKLPPGENIQCLRITTSQPSEPTKKNQFIVVANFIKRQKPGFQNDY